MLSYLRSIENTIPYQSHKSLGRLPIECKGGFEFLWIQDIMYIESDGNYVWIKLKGDIKKFYSCSLAKVETLLSPYNCFYRIHNSYIININQIKAYKKGDGGEVVLDDAERLPVSRNRKIGFLEWIYRVK